MRSWGVQAFATFVLAACFLIFPLSVHATGKQADTDPAGSGGCDPGSKYDPSLPYPQKNPQTGKIGLIGVGCQDTTDGFVTPGQCVAADKCQAKPATSQSPPGSAPPPSLPSLPSLPTNQPPQPSTPQTQAPSNEPQTTASGQVQTPPTSNGFTDNPSELTQSPPNGTQSEPSSDLGQTPPAITQETFTPVSGLDQSPPDSSQSSESLPSDQIQTVPESPQDTFSTDPRSENTPSEPEDDDFSSHCGECSVSYSTGWTESSAANTDESGPTSDAAQYSETSPWASTASEATPIGSNADNAVGNLPSNTDTTNMNTDTTDNSGAALPPYVTDATNFPPESLSEEQSSGLPSDEVQAIAPPSNTYPGETEGGVETPVPSIPGDVAGVSGVASPPLLSNPTPNENPVPQVPAGSQGSQSPQPQTVPNPPAQTPGAALLNSVDPGLGTAVSNIVSNVNQAISQTISSIISRILFP